MRFPPSFSGLAGLAGLWRLPRLIGARALAGAGLGLIAATAAAVPLSLQVVDADGHPVADAVVGVLVRGARSAAPAGTSLQIRQRQRQFEPRVSAVQTGTAVRFPNEDTVRHHVYSFSPAKRFELKLYSGTPAEPVVFDKAGVAVLGCNIHDRMTAHVIVMDTPLVARTDAQGQLTFDLPPGEHVLLGWMPNWGEGEPFAERRLTLGAAALKLTWQPQARPR